MGPSGSSAVEEVVPTVAATKNGVRPAARSSAIAAASASGRSANASSTSIIRSWSGRNPAIRIAFSIELCAWLDV